MLEEGSDIVRAYYTLSAVGIIFSDLPKNVQRTFAKYPQIGATLLGRFGVDRSYKAGLQKNFGCNPRIGEFVFADAQRRALSIARSDIGSGLFVVDVIKPDDDEIANGVRDPIGFYLNYGYVPFPADERRVFKPMRTIAEEENNA